MLLSDVAKRVARCPTLGEHLGTSLTQTVDTGGSSPPASRAYGPDRRGRRPTGCRSRPAV